MVPPLFSISLTFGCVQVNSICANIPIFDSMLQGPSPYFSITTICISTSLLKYVPFERDFLSVMNHHYSCNINVNHVQGLDTRTCTFIHNYMYMYVHVLQTPKMGGAARTLRQTNHATVHTIWPIQAHVDVTNI